jgi:hypothetical protein
MKVSKMIELLSECDPDMEVRITHTTSDYWGTVVTLPVESVEEMDLVWNEYHRTMKVAKEEDDVEAQAVVIGLSSWECN